MLYEDLHSVWKAFWRLSPARPYGFSGASALPFSDVAAYIELFDVPQKAEFVHNIYVLDREYLKLMQELSEKSGKAPTQKSVVEKRKPGGRKH